MTGDSHDDRDAITDPLQDLVAVMRRLRTECAWKAAQTPSSLVPYLREETEELVEAIDTGDPGHVCEELGDVLLQVVFHAAIAEERGDFTIDDVAAGIAAKLRRRNPHVFDPASLGRDADSAPLTATEVNEIWQQVKRDEKAAPEGTTSLGGDPGSPSPPINPGAD